MRSLWLLVLALVQLRLSIRNRAYLVRAALPDPSQSAWAALWAARVDKSFRATMGLDVASFLRLHSFVALAFTLGGPIATCSLDSFGILGLTLHHLNSTMRQKTLCQVFGLTPAVCCRLLEVGLAGLDAAAIFIPECRIVWPKRARMDLSAQKVLQRVSGLAGHSVFGFVDGLNLEIENPMDADEQNAYYNGWLKGVFCSQVLVFDPEGLIIWVRYNCPGSWHDITVASPLLQHMLTVPHPYCLLGDSGFSYGPHMKNKILIPLKSGMLLPAKARARERAQRPSVDITTARQAAEWGMRSLQGTFARFKSVLPSDHAKRARTLRLVWALHNFQVRHTGITQIGQVFDEDWAPGGIGDKDRVAHFYGI